MDRIFFSVMSVMTIILISQFGVGSLNAAEEVPPVRQPPTAAEIERAFENCLKHECEDFGEWSVEAYEACSEGGEECCELARKILAAVHTPHKGEKIYDDYFPHSFPEDDVEEIIPDDVEAFSR